MVSRYSCSLAGQCELDEHGSYSDLPSCRASCQSAEQKKLVFLTTEYVPSEGAAALAPSDRVALIRRLIGVKVPLTDSFTILTALGDDDVNTLAHYPVLYEYMWQHYRTADVIRALFRQATMLSLTEIVNQAAIRYLKVEDYATAIHAIAAAGYEEPTITMLQHVIPLRMLIDTLTGWFVIEAAGADIVGLLKAIHPNFYAPINEDYDSIIDILSSHYRIDIYEALLEDGYYISVHEGLEHAVNEPDLPLDFARWILRHYPEQATADTLADTVRARNENYVIALLEELADDKVRLAKRQLTDEETAYLEKIERWLAIESE